MWASALLMLAATICLPAGPTAAASKRACLNACGGAIASCASTCSAFAKLDRPCRNAILKRCRREGVAVCTAVGTTTTTVATSTTTTTVAGVNLVAGPVVFDPATPTCAQTFTVVLDVTNTGTGATTAAGSVSLLDARALDDSPQGNTLGAFPTLLPGQTFRVNMPITISTWYNEQHDVMLVLDPSDEIVESNEGDNTRLVSYVLAKGACP
jgi:hypothetical protein